MPLFRKRSKAGKAVGDVTELNPHTDAHTDAWKQAEATWNKKSNPDFVPVGDGSGNMIESWKKQKPAEHDWKF
jgi:hypothetical protein